MIRTLIDPAADELNRLLDASPLHVSFGVVLATSMVLVLWGNSVVVLSRRLSSERGARSGEMLTLCAQFVAGLTALGALLLLGWSARDLGLSLPEFEGRHPLGLGVVVLAMVIVAGFGFSGVARPSDELGEAPTRLQLGRLLAGTAFGEEALHRGFSLALWAGSGVGVSGVVVANVSLFALWHLVSAYRERRFHALEVIVPGIGALIFLWSRLAFGSLLIPWLLHAATNIPGLVLARKS